jgi:DNA topoisomerase II
MKLSNKARFILAVVAGTLVVSNRRKAEIEGDLDAQGFDRIVPTKKVT